MSDALREYITDVVRATRAHASVRYGASPRGALALMRAGQALAAIRGRDFVLPDDIKLLAPAVLSHRLVLRDSERLRGEDPARVIAQVLETVAVPSPRE